LSHFDFAPQRASAWRRPEQLTTLIEAHGEAQDVAPEILAQAFFTVMEARKTCHQEQVEEAITLYESIPLRDAISHSQ
jgi:hypothetical protein